jgi:hypothetical protein
VDSQRKESASALSPHDGDGAFIALETRAR